MTLIFYEANSEFH